MEPGTAGATKPSAQTRPPGGLAIAATLIMLGTIALLWLAAVPVGSGVCPAIDPPPTGCLASYRAGSGLVATIVVVTLWGATILAALPRRRTMRPAVVVGVALLALSPFVTYAAVAWSPGFTLPIAPAPPTDDPVGQWGKVGARSAYLTIFDDGTVMGSDGCNGIGGTWSLSSEAVEFSDMFTTLVMCPPRESDLQGAVVAAVAQGDIMYVLDADRNVIGMLQRSAAH